MTLLEAVRARHSVRQYLDLPIEPKKIQLLQEELDRCNAEGGLHLQLITSEPEAFSGSMARYGNFRGVQNYFALVGKKAPDLEERIGYYGERMVLLAQTLGLNTCWVALTFSKNKCPADIGPGERLVCVIALGYGETDGVPHKNKSAGALCRVKGEVPEWFHRGLKSAMLAPTAVNQQKFRFTLIGDQVVAESTGGPYSQVDLGIVKYHFELGAGVQNFTWVCN